MKRVAIIHPWLPQYRKEFFRQLLRRAADEGIAIDIFYGQVSPRWAGRGDQLHGDGDRVIPLTTKFLRIGSRTLALKSLRPVRDRARVQGRYDLVIVEQAVKNLETYGLLLRSPGSVAFWGHGRTYSDQSRGAIERLKGRLTRLGNWFFAYTEGGKSAVVRGGFPSSRITVLNNTFDTEALRSELQSVTREERVEVYERLDLRGKTALYSGGLDSYKRIPMLIDAARTAHQLDNNFRLIVMGDGAERSVVEDAARKYHFIHYVGAQFDHAKAVYLDATDVIVSAGSIGLLVVDGFVARKPVVLTRWPQHGPEAEYLADGRNSVITPDSIEALASGLIALLGDDERLSMLRDNCALDADLYTLENMVTNFLAGVHGALAVLR